MPTDLEAKPQINKADPNSLIGLLQREAPGHLGRMVNDLATGIRRLWSTREEPEGKPPTPPHMNRYEAGSILQRLRWLVVTRWGLEDLVPQFDHLGRRLGVARVAMGQRGPSAERVALRYLEAMAASGPVVKFLQRLRGKGKGTLNINVLEEALPLMGWSIRKTTVALPVSEDEMLGVPLMGLIKKHNPYAKNKGFRGNSAIWGYTGVKELKRVSFPTVEAAERAVAEFKGSYATKASRAPSNPEVGRVYYKHLAYPVKGTPGGAWGTGMFFDITGIWLGVEGYEISGPKGSLLLPVKPHDDPLKWKAARFWTWGYKNGLDEAAAAYLEDLGAEEARRVTAPKSDRSLDGTGTCPCCGQNVKLTARQTIMRHGWKVQGERSWGSYGNTWHSGSCFGVGYPPFEVSKRGAVDYREKAVEPSLAKAEEKLGELQWQQANGIALEYLDRRKRKKVVLEPSDRNYNAAMRQTIAAVTNDVKNLGDLLRTLDAGIAGWSEQPLPGTR